MDSNDGSSLESGPSSRLEDCGHRQDAWLEATRMLSGELCASEFCCEWETLLSVCILISALFYVVLRWNWCCVFLGAHFLKKELAARVLLHLPCAAESAKAAVGSSSE